jgi:transcriptional regulator with XRE-family HTH domain
MICGDVGFSTRDAMRRRIVTMEGPDPIDVHVGRRVRMLRTLKGLSQERLGRALGVSFQQLQKYESGANRISASVLFRASQALDVPVSSFFEGLGETPVADGSAEFDRASLELARDLEQIEDVGMRDALRGLIRSIGGRQRTARNRA